MKDLTMLEPGKETIGNARVVPFTRLIRLTQIKLKDEFKNLFPVNQGNLDKIAARMSEGGYDNSQPLHIWEKDGEYILIDGHHRRIAAIHLGISEVPCYLHSFSDQDEALEYTLSLQTERRNLSEPELFELMPVVDGLKKRGRKCEAGGGGERSNGERNASSEQTAAVLHTSQTKVEKMRTISKHGTAEQIARFKSGEMSLNATYEAVMAAKKGADRAEPAKKRPPALAFLERAVVLLKASGEGHSADLLLEAFLPDPEERGRFRAEIIPPVGRE